MPQRLIPCRWTLGVENMKKYAKALMSTNSDLRIYDAVEISCRYLMRVNSWMLLPLPELQFVHFSRLNSKRLPEPEYLELGSLSS